MFEQWRNASNVIYGETKRLDGERSFTSLFCNDCELTFYKGDPGTIAYRAAKSIASDHGYMLGHRIFSIDFKL